MESVPQSNPPAGKTCSCCGEWRDISRFRKNQGYGDGFRTTCRDCDNAKVRKYKQAHKEELAEKRKIQREENPEKAREKGRESERRRRVRDAEKVRQLRREDYARNRAKYALLKREARKEKQEEAREKDRIRYERDRDKIIARNMEIGHRRRAQKEKGESFTSKEWADLCARYGNICLCCGEVKALTVDHVIPLSKGGTNDISNIQPLCKSCNSSKNAKIIDYR